jgi:hypothetical protein
MGGIFLVGLSGSMVEKAVKTSPSKDRFDTPESVLVDKPEPSSVLLGVFFVLFAQIL